MLLQSGATLTCAEAERAPSVAITEPVPARVAVKTPFGEIVPIWPRTTQLAIIGAAVPEASIPVAWNATVSFGWTEITLPRGATVTDIAGSPWAP